MLVTLSLISAFVCSSFIVLCSIRNKIELYPSTKGILCFVMISTIASLAKYEYAGLPADSLSIVAMSLFMLRQTYVGYRRGYL